MSPPRAGQCLLEAEPIKRDDNDSDQIFTIDFGWMALQS